LGFVRVFIRGVGVGFLFRSCIKNSTDAQKHNDFFAIVKSIFVDVFSNGRLNFYDKHFLRDLAWKLRSRLPNLLIYNDLRRAAGRARVSA
jgi:hypothetical protein